MSIADDLIMLLAERGGAMYGNEAVTQLAHGVQCALLAERSGATPATISAALLHDIGHLVLEDDAEAASDGIDLQHEKIGADHLAQWFGDDVIQPVRLHVDAKRLLCATDPEYFATLSPASVTSLEVQGGPFTGREAEYFLSRPYAQEAVSLRRWDDLAKDPGVQTPPVQHFRKYLEQSLKKAA
ncbi:MAG: phosphonate degradation HD-domain oxygenase [Minwuia sp.]|uniref:phosphonate degradation HD-domain oxygenase n=1 Tax=Minwuia sp. TaxID=2493630 RepID=UPI003A8522AC